MKKREFLLRAFIGVGCIVVFTSLIVWRQHVIRSQREQKIVSTISEWETHGKPVRIQNVAHQDMRVYEKITITPLSPTIYEGYVTKDIQERLRPGQTVYVDTDQGEREFGMIRYVDHVLDIDTGMFRVRAAFGPEVTLSKHIIVAYAHINTLKDVMRIPNEIITEEEGEFFAWTVRDGHAYRQNILLGERNGYGTVVLQGLHVGDMIVIQGQTQLSDGDKVRIVDGQEVARHIP